MLLENYLALPQTYKSHHKTVEGTTILALEILLGTTLQICTTKTHQQHLADKNQHRYNMDDRMHYPK